MSIVIRKNFKYYLYKIFTYIFLTMIAIITLIPFVIMIITSLKDSGSFVSNLLSFLPEKISFTNYIEVWKDDSFGIYFFNTIIVTIFVILANVILDSMVAYVLSRKKFKGKKIIFTVILGRMMIPIQVLIIPIYILSKHIGIYDTLLALILPNAVQGFGIFLMKQYFDNIPLALDEAAIIDGANDFQILRHILFPIAKPAIAVLIINTALTTWNAFLLPLILTQSVNNRVIGLGLALYRTQFSVDYFHSLAASTITTIPILILFLFFQKYIIAGLTKGAIK